MEYVLTSSEMKKCDEDTINEYGIPSLVLMERAALQTVHAIICKYGTDICVGVMAGSGNNGGDGIAIARILYEQGIHVEINMIGESAKLTTETAAQFETAKKLNIPIHYGLDSTLYDVIVDAMFGIGITRDVEGKYKKTIEAVNASKAAVVAVDIPSGINADDGSVMGCAVKADMTVTFAYRKLGLMLYPGASYAGEVVCVPIGIPPILTENKRRGIVTFTDVKNDLKLPERNPAGNKGTFGKVLLIAGSKNMGGACYLSALSAYRIGAGMVRIFTSSNNREALLKKLPEAIVDTYEDDKEQKLSKEEAEVLNIALEWADVIAIGPGISLSERAEEILELVLAYCNGEECSMPMVIDADALNLLSRNEELLNYFKIGWKKNDGDVIFTPHMGEFARLMQVPVTELKKDILTNCKNFTKKYDVSLICKDARTIVTKRGKLTYLNASGNHGMATAGAGDVLTGIIAGLLAQKTSGFEAAVMGTYAHGLAGDIAKEKMSANYLMAQDIIHALKYLKYTGGQKD